MTPPIDRRQLLALLGLGCATLWSTRARATLVRGLTLEALSKASDRILVGTPLDANSHWETVGGRRRIVTDSRVRIDNVISGPEADSEVVVRTYGGKVGSAGELLFGEAELVNKVPCVLFLRSSGPVHYVLGMAQGHYPLYEGVTETRYLKASPRLPRLLHPERSAVHRLAGRELSQALALIREARGS